ncbi:MAG: PilZ domain-containing protein [Phycisphaeraceae bacterium]|nr:PilZ domain-containing protein [Phycisphaeraceae bacterium]
MSLKLDHTAESRHHPRLRLPAMYTLLRARLQGETKFRRTGYVYDISHSGMRFELDDPIEPGSLLEVRVLLPGHQTTTFSAVGHVVRLHDDANEPGPVRMGLSFHRFATVADEQGLDQYIVSRTRLSAAA